jgi:hypothetical protein
MLAKNPEDRFSVPADVATAIQPLCAGHSLGELQSSYAQQVASTGREHEGDTTELTRRYSQAQDKPLPTTAEMRNERPKAPPRRWMLVLVAGLSGVAVAAAVAFFLLRDHDSIPSDPPIPRREDSQPTPGPGLSDAVPGPHAEAGPRMLETLPPGAWHALLDRPPTEVFWPQDNFSNWIPSPALHQVSAQCNHQGLLQLGTIDSDSYSVRVGIHQSRWTGGIGVFFGLRESVHKESPSLRYQFLEIRSKKRGDEPATFNVTRGLTEVTQTARGTRAFDSWTLCAASMPEPTDEQVLEFQVRDLTLQAVMLNGSELPNLLSAFGNQLPEAEDYRGAFGVVASHSSSTIRNAELKIHAGEK